MSYLNIIENSLLQQHALLKGINEQLGLHVSISEQGWIVKDHQEHVLILPTRQVPGEIGALEEKLRRVFFN